MMSRTRAGYVILTGLGCMWALSCGCRRDLPSAGPAATESEPGAPIIGPPAADAGVGLDRDAPTLPGPAEAATVADRPLAELLLSESDRQVLEARRLGQGPQTLPAPPPIDAQRVAAAGVRCLRGRHITIYTDLPPRPAVDELPDVFDRAVPLWCDYFELPRERAADWQVTGYLVAARERHVRAGLWPANLPEFLHGFQRDAELWWYEQDSDYFRRHLLLHEGVHAFMAHQLGGTGPPWYREGMAELLATHRWTARQLVVGVMPPDRDSVPLWGRVKAIQDEYQAGRGLMLREIMRVENSAFLRTIPYAWCWAAAAFLDGTPAYRQRFRALRERVADNTAFFTRDFESSLADELRALDEQWQVFVINIDYGYDFVRNAVLYAPGAPLPAGGTVCSLRVDRGWQSTGVRLEAGKTYQLQAQGRYQLQQQPEVWWCEPEGISLEYVRGYPLGMLLGNIRLEEAQPGVANLGNPVPVGLGRRIRAAGPGTLYLRINEAPNRWADNVGELLVRIQAADDATPSRGGPALGRATVEDGLSD